MILILDNLLSYILYYLQQNNDFKGYKTILQNNINIKILVLLFCAFLLKLIVEQNNYSNNHIVFYIRL
jgi:hypothetical protein